MWTTPANLDIDAHQFVDEEAETGKEYIYRVRSMKGNGQNRLSNPVVITVQ